MTNARAPMRKQRLLIRNCGGGWWRVVLMVRVGGGDIPYLTRHVRSWAEVPDCARLVWAHRPFNPYDPNGDRSTSGEAAHA